ncbi:transglycosylase domain-containing protein [Bittarella massiliensis (ex Durand et al. 2017)]|uniref:transglycosylase domain-containing protein n=1 Tax=Bittarella massiliensis (ex Durand et al. 2017) TaxID=1720313 RepID=UPI001AA19B3E|nr:biosynthetic peptidoglycan transglycosylase [Bittarella massiliensis (ex Durand et al. 2017)]MBO1679631.1 transglycosylase domain-containing protein [Bittarella massiliensis (ex Durand et al. 2017)]
MKRFLRYLRNALIAVLCLAIIAGTAFAVACFGDYRKRVEAEPVAEKVAALRQEEGYVPIGEISENFQNAIVAIEDHRFYSHGGIDIISIGRVLWKSLWNGRIVGGASTITQQVCKNIYLSQEQSLSRKVTEVFFAFKLERELSKEEILELYCNTSYFGNGRTGIAAASAYYHTAPSDLTVAQAAFLAALPQAPSYFADNPEQMEGRWRAVLGAMVAYGYLTEGERDEIVAQGCPIPEELR